MDKPNLKKPEIPFNSAVSFKPLFRAWIANIKEGREGAGRLYEQLMEEVKKYPELMDPIHDMEIIRKHKLLIDEMMATIFPITLSYKEDLFAVSVPLTYHTIHSSDLFRSLFLTPDGDMVQIPDEKTGDKLREEKRAGAYQLILKKFYNIQLGGNVASIHNYKNPETGLDKYIELAIDARFIDVFTDQPLPEMPEDCASNCHRLDDILNKPELMDWLPLDKFRFEGIAIIHIKEVTERSIINNIKNTLLTLHSFTDVEGFKQLQDQIENLVGVPGVHIGITPFFRVNSHYVFSELHNASSIFLNALEGSEEKIKLFQQIQRIFGKSQELLVIPTLDDEAIKNYPFFSTLREAGWKGVIVCPLYHNQRLIGILEIVTKSEGKLDNKIVSKMEPAIPLFELALEKTAENLDSQIDKVIKEQFTAVQSSVEWRFTEAALNYLTRVQKDEDTKIENIVFENVHPLYGAIDIRNSSTERNLAIQKDMLEQLEMAGTIVRKAQEKSKYPLLEEIDYKIRKYTHSVSNIILSDDEIAINHFLKEEIVQLFQHLKIVSPHLEKEIESYFSSINAGVEMVYHHRKDFDESITYINKAVARFMDREQQAAQQIYPHYFERFVTDGVDFNIYIGQSITPLIPFDEFYLKNLKIWQLTTLAKAARLSRKLENNIPISLQTTQLILAHGFPISISFRPAERKFDVDGAYNIRYEIVKKRIDKVRIKDTNERLTQPGQIAIVYSQPKEATEYMEYIEYLQTQGLLMQDIEKLELEELQGVSGLKALRVAVNLDAEPIEEKKDEKKKSAKL
ncbi:MAG TPA: hypothetical protein VM012_10750 [Flavitalea sp.]|nr:hypothetical protein [Flavitalea sp.]